MYIYIYIYIYMCVRVNTYIYIYICVCEQIYIYIYINMVNFFYYTPLGQKNFFGARSAPKFFREGKKRVPIERTRGDLFKSVSNCVLECHLRALSYPFGEYFVIYESKTFFEKKKYFFHAFQKLLV